MGAETSFGSILVTFMVDVAVLAGVPLAVATGTGFLVSFLQAITQVQDQSLSQTIKIVAVVVVLLVFGQRLTAPLLNSTILVFDQFHLMVQ